MSSPSFAPFPFTILLPAPACSVARRTGDPDDSCYYIALGSARKVPRTGGYLRLFGDPVAPARVDVVDMTSVPPALTLEELGELTPDDRSLLQVTEDVWRRAHTFHDGPVVEQEADVIYLRGRVARWRPSVPGCETWDALVKTLVHVALRAAGVDHV